MLYEEQEAKLKIKITKLIKNRKIHVDNEVVIFGASENSKIMMGMLRKQGINPSYVVDNDSKKWGTWCSGCEVKKPEILAEINKDNNIRIILYSYYYYEIIDQIENYGYTKNRDFFDVTEKAEWKRFFIYNVGLVIRAKFWQDGIRKKYGDDCNVLICPYTGTGDIYLIGTMLQQYLDKHGFDNYVFVVVSTACRKVAGLFNILNVIQLKKREVERLVKATIFAPRLFDFEILNDSWASVYTNPVEWIRGYKGLNFTDMFRHAVFEFIDNPKLLHPKLKDVSDEVDKFFSDNDLYPGKTVILAPYSNTLSELPDEFWKDIVKNLKDKGYVVCTNSSGSKEPAIEGTIAVFFPYSIAVQILNMAGGFIGVRSGFCDVISSSKAKKIIIYEKGSYFYQGSTFDYFSLNGMGLCGDAIEVFYDSNLYKEITDIF